MLCPSLLTQAGEFKIFFSSQFHWNDYSDSGYLIALHHLKELQAEGRIRLLGLCNFDAVRTDEICTRLGPGSIVTNQVQVGTVSFVKLSPLKCESQFSLIDTRPLYGMSHVCEKHNIKLLTYGTLVSSSSKFSRCLISTRKYSAGAFCRTNGLESLNRIPIRSK